MFEKILGELCSRCDRKRTKSKLEGLPICDACELEIRADREEMKYCPDCDVSMNKCIVLNVIVDKCPDCHGAWLDGGELNLIKMAVDSGAGGDFATGMVLGMAIG